MEVTLSVSEQHTIVEGYRVMARTTPMMNPNVIGRTVVRPNA